jgi:hypothetical protein
MKLRGPYASASIASFFRRITGLAGLPLATPEYICGLEADNELKIGRLHHWQVLTQSTLCRHSIRGLKKFRLRSSGHGHFRK